MSHMTVAAASLPRDALANVFLRLPASDLRRCSRVCKEWHEVISDPVFVHEHMHHGPWALTHTIVFLGEANGAHRGQGFLFDEDWRLVARFSAGESEDLMGTCNGLLCFLDVHRGAINVVEPFTGESLALPLPPRTDTLDDDRAYCFGFDPCSRRYMIAHLGLDDDDDATEQDLYMYTIGEGENWRKVQTAVTPYRNPVFAGDGSLYLSGKTDQLAKLARFDLAPTGKMRLISITNFLPVDDRGRAFHLMTDSDARACVMTGGLSGEYDMFSMGESGHSSEHSIVILSPGRRLMLPQALQRGHLLLKDYLDGGLYAHPVEPAGHDLGSGKLLLKLGSEKHEAPAKSSARGLFVPAHLNQAPEMLDSPKWRTFCYAPPLSPAPLTQRCGFPCWSPAATSCGKQSYK